MTGVQKKTVSKDEDGTRVDQWFFRHFPDVPKGHLYKLLRKGQIRVDSKRMKPGSRLKQGQIVRVPPLKSDGPSATKKLPVSDRDRTFLKSLVLYEDDDLLVLNKPSDLAVQGGSGLTQHLDAYLYVFENHDGVVPRLVHRLDKQTSGALILARNAPAARALGKAFKDQKVRKYYWGLTSPAPDSSAGEIKAPLKKGSGTDKEHMMVDDKEGKKAVTLFEVIDQASKKFAFVCFWPRTGRTHQIRVHANVVGAPLIGDSKYGGQQIMHDLLESDNALKERLYLHARRLICPHPAGQGLIDVTAPLSDKDKILWRHLGFDPEFQGDVFEDIEL